MTTISGNTNHGTALSAIWMLGIFSGTVATPSTHSKLRVRKPRETRAPHPPHPPGRTMNTAVDLEPWVTHHKGIFENAYAVDEDASSSLVASYLDYVSNETTSEQSFRFLQDHDYIRRQVREGQGATAGPYFRPLDCKRPACQISTTWTKGNIGRNAHKGTVVIPCGTCVWMDYVADDHHEEYEHQGPTLVLPHGMDIQGRLHFPDNGYKLTIEAPFLLVQGLLDIPSTGRVGRDPMIKFHIKSEQRSISFLPAYNNERVCPDVASGEPSTCDIGFRSIVVAGGQIRTQGLPQNCKTWTQLEDVLPVPKVSQSQRIHHHRHFTQLPQVDVNHPNPICRVRGPFIQDDFSAVKIARTSWTGGYGATFAVVDGIFATENRKSIAEHGPTIDMLSFVECLIPGQVYLFSAKIRLHDPADPDEAPTPCDAAGCLDLLFQTRLPEDGETLTRRKGNRFANEQYRNNVWGNFYATMTFSEGELSPRNAFQVLQLRGAPARYNIYMDNVTFMLPPESLVPNPDDLCSNNLVLNGNAQASEIHPYPMKALGGHLTVETSPDTGNRVFLVSRRKRNWDSLAYHLDAPSCVETGARFLVSARFYAVSDVPVELVIKYHIKLRDGRAHSHTAAKCPASRKIWKDCHSKFSIVDTIEPADIEHVRFWFETVNAPTVDYMVDDFVIEKAKPPKAEILVSGKGIVDCWDEGAEIVITSHTTNTADSQVRRLVHPPIPTGRGGMVRLELDDSIALPVTKKHDEGLFPVEVALLSRNIRFESPEDTDDPLIGGHFLVLRTPNVVQRIQGIEIVNFGQQGEPVQSCCLTGTLR